MTDFSKLLERFEAHKLFKCQLKDTTSIFILSDDSILFDSPKDENELIGFLNYLVDNVSNEDIVFSVEIPYDETHLLNLMKKTKFECTHCGVFYTYLSPITKNG